MNKNKQAKISLMIAENLFYGLTLLTFGLAILEAISENYGLATFTIGITLFCLICYLDAERMGKELRK